MKKRKTIKIASITIGVLIVGMFLFAMPLIGADKSSDVQSSQSPSVNTVKTEEATVSNDINEANDVEEATASGDLKEDDENLPEGGHEDLDGVNVENEFEGIE